MALNPYFLQGSQAEQRLVQNLVNEQLKIFGVEVTYIPRKFVNTQSIIEEVTTSKFDDNFQIEAYVNTYEGYAGAGDVLTKFGMSLRDEVTLTISKERFEDFISPFMSADEDIELSTKIKLNVGFPTKSLIDSRLPVDGVGLARIEFILSSELGIHPLAFVHHEAMKEYVSTGSLPDELKPYQESFIQADLSFFAEEESERGN